MTGVQTCALPIYPLSSSVLGVFLDIGRDGMLKDWILAWNGGKKAETFLWEIDE